MAAMLIIEGYRWGVELNFAPGICLITFGVIIVCGSIASSLGVGSSRTAWERRSNRSHDSLQVTMRESIAFRSARQQNMRLESTFACNDRLASAVSRESGMVSVERTSC